MVFAKVGENFEGEAKWASDSKLLGSVTARNFENPGIRAGSFCCVEFSGENRDCKSQCPIRK
jgi:hypothetical protein